MRFSFHGIRLRECGAHMHYIEEALRVPYRYDMDFHWKIRDYDGQYSCVIIQGIQPIK